jgi:hypothetical protein
MRVRLDPVGVHNANLIANHFGRSVSNAASVALAELVRNNIGNGKTIQPDEAEAIFGSGKAIAAHASGALAAAVNMRSASSGVLAQRCAFCCAFPIHYRQTAPNGAA